MMINKFALALTIVGAVNWGLIGIFQFDLVSFITGGGGDPAPDNLLARILYTIVALAGVWCISLLFREDDDAVIAAHG